MHEIKSLEEAEALSREFCLREAELDRRTGEIASHLVRKSIYTSGSPDSGGDFWFHVAGGSEPEDYLCNIPPCPLDLCLDAADDRSRRRVAQKFLEQRNDYFIRAIARFRGRPAPRG